jgi:hypothetical protein
MDKYYSDPTVLKIEHCKLDPLGETMGERYESLYVKLFYTMKALIGEGAKPIFKVVTGRDIGLIFVCSSCGWSGPPDWETSKGRFDLGMINRRFQLIMDDDMPSKVVEINSTIGKVVLVCEGLSW